MSKFQVGDRVAVYSGPRRFIGRVNSAIGTLGDSNYHSVHVIEDGFYLVHEDGPFHPKQCRKLKAKTRREFWVNPRFLPKDPAFTTLLPNGEQICSTRAVAGFTHVREVKK